MSLDDLIEAIRDMLPVRFPNAEWAALCIHLGKGIPDVIIPCNKREKPTEDRPAEATVGK